ncbi:MAG: crossover junction endodeoxyribonuclease RuvC [Clostridia bacterium]|nr:crossover junction endodeoxyribonuclease RuvC [Clostridia bacterium]
MIILGIDPGLAIVGYGVIEYNSPNFRTLAHGAILTPAHTNVEDRLLEIYDKLSELITIYKPDAVAVEELFFNTNQKTVITVAESRGCILLCCKKNNVPLFEYTPLQVKQSVVGYGRADKKQVIHMVKLLLKLESAPKLDDTCDALAIAICHANCSGSRIRNYFNRRT